MALAIVITNTAGVPIYEQIVQQVKDAILSGDLAADEALPSIRALARDLRVSVITTTRAYTELVEQGFVTTMPGKGYFVLPRDAGLAREQILREIEEHLSAAVDRALVLDLPATELHQMLDICLDTQEES